MNQNVKDILIGLVSLSLEDKKVNCSLYKSLKDELPDQYLIIESVFQIESFDEIQENLFFVKIAAV